MYPQRSAEDGLVPGLIHIAGLEQVLGDGRPAHPPGQRGGAAEGLYIHKIAPPADELADEQTVYPQISEGQEADLSDLAEDQQHDDRGDDSPIDGKSAIAVPKDGPQSSEPSPHRYRSRLKIT